MKLITIMMSLSILAIFGSCQNSESDDNAEKQQKGAAKVGNTQTLPDHNFEVNADALLKDYMTWYSYHYRTIHLAQDFTGLDTDSTQLTKGEFLTKLATGAYIALKTNLKGGLPVYTLHEASLFDQNRQRTIKSLVSHELKNTSWEGKEIPEFSFTDLEGKVYDKASTKGKILVLKCWFIGCTACVKEFPELNQLVDEYRESPGIQFVSLASDTKPQLESFIKKKPFKYAVVPAQGSFMVDKLEIEMYPTHLVVDGSGKVLKVVNDVKDLRIFLEKH